MAKAKGSPKTGGRKKGTSNKITADVREAILEAFHMAGGVEYLRALAFSDPKAFCTLLAKIIPAKVAGDEENPSALRVTRRSPYPTRRESNGLPEQRESGGLIAPQPGPQTEAIAARWGALSFSSPLGTRLACQSSTALARLARA